MKLGPALLSILMSLMAASPAVLQEAVVTGGLPFEATESFPSLLLRVDVSLILASWRIVGVMACPAVPTGVITCVIVENAYPVGLLEVVRRPFATHLLEFGPILKGMAPAQLFGSTSSHGPNAADGTGLQFAEAHVYSFSPQIPVLSQVLPLVIPPAIPYGLAYSSEIDGYFWRTGLAEWLLKPGEMARKQLLPACSVIPRTQECAGVWGSYVPRIGFTVHPSEVLAAYLQALRAGRVASDPVGRVVLGSYPYEPRTGHYLQMIRPSLRSGTLIGTPFTRLLEAGSLSAQGAYIFIHYGIFKECKGCMPPTLVEARLPL